MTRSERLTRINAALATGEKRARQELAKANLELAAADADLQTVLQQCHHAGSQPSLPIAAGLAVIESGLAEAAEREAHRRAATDDVTEKSERWIEANSRHEAATRLLDRWQEEVDAEAERRAESELGEVVAAQRVFTATTTRSAKDGSQ